MISRSVRYLIDGELTVFVSLTRTLIDWINRQQAYEGLPKNRNPQNPRNPLTV